MQSMATIEAGPNHDHGYQPGAEKAGCSKDEDTSAHDDEEDQGEQCEGAAIQRRQQHGKRQQQDPQHSEHSSVNAAGSLVQVSAQSKDDYSSLRGGSYGDNHDPDHAEPA